MKATLSPHPRRDFLKRTALATTAVAVANIISAAEPPRRIRVGFLGTAHSHFKEKHEVIRISPDLELVGLSEEDEAVRNRGLAGANWLSADDLFSKAEVIVVESQVKDHARHAKRALEAGKHVHVEKPPADTVQGLKELLDLAGEKKRFLQVGYMWRFNPGMVAVLEAARQGWLGEIYLVRATMNTLVGPEQRRLWAPFRGGAMFEQGSHLIDPLVRLLGKPSRVTPYLKKTSEDNLADNCVAVFEFARAMGIVTSAPLQPNAGAQRFFEVLGKNGTARVQPLEPPQLTIDLGKASGPYPAGRSEVPLPVYRRYVDEFIALVKSIRTGEPLPVTPAKELEVHQALMAACEMG